MRPITLINTIRKLLSLVVLSRIAKQVSAFLGPTQSGFRAGRSTSDVVWSQRWLAAKAMRSHWDCHVLGLDMSRAFDTIDRSKLLDVMRNVTGPDEVCIIHHLLYQTSISVKIGKILSSPFESTIGTPQGDGLSPVLFVCYLEAALRDCRSNLTPRPREDALIPHETGYADDINMYSRQRQWLERSLPIVSDTLGDWNLKVNQTKTEWIHLSGDSTGWRSSRQLGSLLGEEEDTIRRINQASKSFGQLYSVWLRKSFISQERRMKLYNAIVIPTLLYNCETWGVTEAVLSRLDVFHRKQLRCITGIRHPNRITNDDLYERCSTEPISKKIKKRRQRMTGHVLRMAEDTPAAKAMECYLAGDARGRVGRPKTTLATKTIGDLQSLAIPLRNGQDLVAARERAADRKAWRELCQPA